jgi:hypothetical protein
MQSMGSLVELVWSVLVQKQACTKSTFFVLLSLKGTWKGGQEN